MIAANYTPVSYTVKEAVSVSGIGRTKMFELFKRNELTRLKVDGKTLVMREDLLNFLNSKVKAQGSI